MGLKIPMATQDSPNYLVWEEDPLVLLNDPDSNKRAKIKGVRDSWVRDYVIKHSETIKVVTVLRKNSGYTRGANGLLNYTNGEPEVSWWYEVPAPINNDTPTDVMDQIHKQVGPNAVILPTPKQMALDWKLLVGINDQVKVPWSNAKAAGVSHQPAILPQSEYAFDVVVTDEEHPSLDGCMRVSKKIMANMVAAYNLDKMINEEGQVIHLPTAIKLSGIWPHSSKVVFYLDPNTDEPGELLYWNGNDKGEPRKPGKHTFKISEFRLVSVSDWFYRIGCNLSYQLLGLCDNWREVVEAELVPLVTDLQDAILGDSYAMQKILKVHDAFDLLPGNIPTEDGLNRELRMQAEFLFAAGATADTHPTCQRATWQAAHWYANQLRKGFYTEKGHTALALPSAKCRRGDIILSRKAWNAFGRPQTVTVVRYPINQKSEIRQYKVHYTFRTNTAPDHAAYVNPEDWKEFHNGDFDGDTIFIYNFKLKTSPKPHLDMTKGTGRVVTTAYEDAYKTQASGASVGTICNMLSLIRCIVQCTGVDLSYAEDILAQSYHMSIQATKNGDFDARSIMRSVRGYLKTLGFPTTMPWLHKEMGRAALDWNARVKHYSSIDATWKSHVSHTDKTWDLCLTGWVHNLLGNLPAFEIVEQQPFDRAGFAQKIMAEPVMAFSTVTEDIAKGLMDAFRDAVAYAAGDALTGRQPSKPSFTAVYEAAAKVRALPVTDRVSVAVRFGQVIATSKMSDFLFTLIAPLGPGELANRVYGGTALDNLPGLVRHYACTGAIERMSDYLAHNLSAPLPAVLPPAECSLVLENKPDHMNQES